MFDLPLNEEEARIYLQSAADFLAQNPAAHYLCVGHSYSFFGAALAVLSPHNVAHVPFSATRGAGVVAHVAALQKTRGLFHQQAEVGQENRIGILALREKLRATGNSPKEILARDGETFLLDYADTGRGLVSMAEIIFAWAKEENCNLQRLAEKVVLVIQNDKFAPPAKTWRLCFSCQPSKKAGAKETTVNLRVRKVLPASSGTKEHLIAPDFRGYHFGYRILPRMSAKALTAANGCWDSAVKSMNTPEELAGLSNMAKVWPLIEARMRLIAQEIGLLPATVRSGLRQSTGHRLG